MAQLSPVARALLDTIAGPESKGAYNVNYGGSTFSDYSAHPNKPTLISSGPNKGKYSTAAGKYQFLGSTWDGVARDAGLKDFSPASQDAGAWYLASSEYTRKTGRDLETDLNNGDLSRVPAALKGQWTSMPGGIEQGINGSAFASAYASNLSNPAAAAIDDAAGGGWLGGFLGGAVDGIGNAYNATVGAIGEGKQYVENMVQEAPQKYGPALVSSMLGSVGGRSTIMRYLMNQNVGQAPIMVAGSQPGGSPVMAVNNKGATAATLMRPADGPGGKSSQAFDQQYHAGQNMDVYRANRAAIGSPINQQSINQALASGKTLFKST